MTTAKKITLHSHTTFCDGKNSPEEMVLAAIEKGFSVIGFSGHSFYPLTPTVYSSFDHLWHIPDGDFENYVKTIRELSDKYSDKIKVLLGFEADFLIIPEVGSTRPDFTPYSPLNPDYLIGSVHFVSTDKGFYSVDHKTDVVLKKIKELYALPAGASKANSECNFDARAVVHDYFEAEREMLKTCQFNILGHPDLIRLRNQDLHYFDENDSWYKEEVQQTVKAAAAAGVSVEINTGAIGRNLMTDSYPSDYFLSILHDAGVPICINSDSHNVTTLDAAYDHAILKAKKAGYGELIYPTRTGNFVIKI